MLRTIEFPFSVDKNVNVSIIFTSIFDINLSLLSTPRIFRTLSLDLFFIVEIALVFCLRLLLLRP